MHFGERKTRGYTGSEDPRLRWPAVGLHRDLDVRDDVPLGELGRLPVRGGPGVRSDRGTARPRGDPGAAVHRCSTDLPGLREPVTSAFRQYSPARA